MKKGKTTLKRKIQQTNDNPAIIEGEEYRESKIIKGKTSLGKNKNIKKQTNEENNSQNLIEQIILTYFTARWQDKIAAIKNRVSARPNKKSQDLRALVRVLDRAINYHTYLHLLDLYNNMINMPVPDGIEHDPNFGKIFLVNEKEEEEEEEDKPVEIIMEKIVVKDKEKLREKGDFDKNKPKKNTNYEEEDVDEELAIYYYRNDGKTIDRLEIEKDINRLMEENPGKDIDVERILNSKRLQYKLKNPRFSPFTKFKKENIESFVRYLYTYKPGKNKENNEKIIVIKNKTYAYY